MKWKLSVAVALLVGCSQSTTPQTGTRGDASDPDGGSALDTAMSEPDVSSDAAADAPTADLGADADPDVAITGCAALGPAACFDDPSCMLAESCVDADGQGTPDELVSSFAWDAVVTAAADGPLPPGDHDATLSVFRVDDWSLQGVLSIPSASVTHRMWGGINPQGVVGLWVGPPECPRAECATTFGKAYQAYGSASDVAFEITAVQAESIIDVDSFTSLRAVPHDGFKPVGPEVMRVDPLVGPWSGELLAANGDGSAVFAQCFFAISHDVTYQIDSFRCIDKDSGQDLAAFGSPDAASVAFDAQNFWVALGTEQTSPVVVARIDGEKLITGVVGRRADVWAAGPPTAAADVPIEHVIGNVRFVWSN